MTEQELADFRENLRIDKYLAFTAGKVPNGAARWKAWVMSWASGK